MSLGVHVERLSRAVGFAALAVTWFWLALFVGIGSGDTCFGFTLVDPNTGGEECEGFLNPLPHAGRLALQLMFFLGAGAVAYDKIRPQAAGSKIKGPKAILKRLVGILLIVYGWMQVLPLTHGSILWMLHPRQDGGEPNYRLMYIRLFIGGLAILPGHALRSGTRIVAEPSAINVPPAAAG